MGGKRGFGEKNSVLALAESEWSAEAKAPPLAARPK